jgi:hypothetical protein
MAESSARIAEQAATAAVGRASDPAPKDAQEAADQVAGAATDEAAAIAGEKS